MAQDIVSGLFGLSPAQVQQQRQNQLALQAQQYAQQDPFQRAQAGMYQAGANLAQAGAEGLFGMQNPEVVAAQQRQAMAQQMDLTTPQGTYAAAKMAQDRGDVEMAARLAAMARQMEEEQSVQQFRAAQTQQMLTPKPEKVDYSSKAKELIDAGYAYGTPEFNSKMREYITAELTGKKKGSGTTVNISTEQENALQKELGKGSAEALLKGQEAAQDAVEIINTVNEGRALLDKGIKTGAFADARVAFGQALKDAGIAEGDDSIANSQAYVATMAQNVGKLIKQFGAGTGLSDADRKYAEAMAGGRIDIDEKAIRHILDINEKAARRVAELHNKRASSVKTIVPITVDIPATYSGKAEPVASGGWSAKIKR